MALQLALLESVPQTKYLSETSFQYYRPIMRLFYLEHQKMHYQLDLDTILGMMHQESAFQDYTAEQLDLDLNQLVRWKSLTAIQDPHRHYTIADFRNRRFQYMLTPEAVEIERLTITLENLSTRTAGLSTNGFRRIRQALDAASRLDQMSSSEIFSWWQDLESDFDRLNQNHQDYLREFYDPNTGRHMRAAEFVSYKQRLVRYLEEFIQQLQSSSAQIEAQLEAFTPEEVRHILEMVHRSQMDVPVPPSEDTPDRERLLRERAENLWQSLTDWFIGRTSSARQVLEVTNEVIRQVVQNAALLVQMQGIGVSNKAELHHLLRIFASCTDIQEAHRLSSLVFGAQRVRHFMVNADRETDQMDVSTYEEAPVVYELKPSVRSYRPRMEKSGFQDRSEEKAEQRRRILEEAREQERLVMAYVKDGVLDFGAIAEPVPPEVRTVFLGWIGLANLSPDGRGHTQYGQTFRLRRRSRKTCRLVCTDGVLTMPDVTLVFEAGKGGKRLG